MAKVVHQLDSGPLQAQEHQSLQRESYIYTSLHRRIPILYDLLYRLPATPLHLLAYDGTAPKGPPFQHHAHSVNIHDTTHH